MRSQGWGAQKGVSIIQRGGESGRPGLSTHAPNPPHPRRSRHAPLTLPHPFPAGAPAQPTSSPPCRIRSVIPALAAGISPCTTPKPVPAPVPSSLRPAPSFLRRQESTARRCSIPTLIPRRRSDDTWAGRRDAGARRGLGGRLDSCLRRNDEEGACEGGEVGAWLGAHHGEIPAASAGMTELGLLSKQIGNHGVHCRAVGLAAEFGH